MDRGEGKETYSYCEQNWISLARIGSAFHPSRHRQVSVWTKKISVASPARYGAEGRGEAEFDILLRYAYLPGLHVCSPWVIDICRCYKEGMLRKYANGCLEHKPLVCTGDRPSRKSAWNVHTGPTAPDL